MKLKSWLLAAAAALLMLGCALEPVISLQSAKDGLNLFLTVVLPSLLPFMVSAGLFIESGAAGSMGRLLTRFMRPVFACPGEAAFALTAGLLSGYPTGARIALDLRQENLISDEDAARTGLLASSCGPVFILGAVGAGLLGSPAAGWIIALSHYTAVIATGLLFSIGGNRRSVETVGAPEIPSAGTTVMAALGSAIQKTVDTLWAVGGYIVLFSVVAGLLTHYHLLLPIASALAPVLRLIGLDPSLAGPMLIGAVEMTNGCGAVAQTMTPMADKCAAVAMLVSFGGFCIQAQSMLFLSGVRLSAWKFTLMKTVQALIALVFCRLFAALPIFSSALCISAGAGFSPASALGASAVYAAGLMLPCLALALVSGRASTRGSV